MPPIRRRPKAAKPANGPRRKVAGRTNARSQAPTPEDQSTERPDQQADSPDTEAPDADAAENTAADSEAPEADAAEPDAGDQDSDQVADDAAEDTDAAGDSDSTDDASAEDSDDLDEDGSDDSESAADDADTDEPDSETSEDDTEPDEDDSASDEDDDEATSRRGRLAALPVRPLAAAAIVVGLAAAAAGAYFATSPGVDVDNEAWVDQAQTDEVLTAATANVQRLVSIDHESLDEYHASLGEFLTPELVTELDETWDVLADTYEQTQTVVDAQVQEAGLSFLDGDRAEVLLVQDVSMTREGIAAGATSGTYLVGLTRIDGEWKLSSIPDLPT